ARIVDEDVNCPDLGLEAVDRLADSRMVGGIEGERACATEAFGSGRELGFIAAIQNDLRARSGKTARQRKADALRRTGDQGALARQIKQLCAHVSSRSGRAQRAICFTLRTLAEIDLRLHRLALVRGD